MRRTTVYIGNLCWEVEEEQLRQLFAPCGAIEHMRLVRDMDTGRSKGFAFIDFGTTQAAQRALELNYQMHQGRRLRVALANPRAVEPDE